VQDPGRANSERAIERGTNKKWLDGMKANADMEVAEAMRKVKYVVPTLHCAGTFEHS
jgi:hypothetical protein